MDIPEVIAKEPDGQEELMERNMRETNKNL